MKFKLIDSVKLAEGSTVRVTLERDENGLDLINLDVLRHGVSYSNLRFQFEEIEALYKLAIDLKEKADKVEEVLFNDYD